MNKSILITQSFQNDFVQSIGRYDKFPSVEQTGLKNINMQRSYEIIRRLQSFYPNILKDSRNNLQLLIGQLRYSGRTMIYIDSNEWKKL